MSLDAKDRKILSELQRDSRLTMQELGERTGMSSSACWRRVKSLEEAGIIDRYAVIADTRKAISFDTSNAGLLPASTIVMFIWPQCLLCASSAATVNPVMPAPTTTISNGRFTRAEPRGTIWAAARQGPSCAWQKVIAHRAQDRSPAYPGFLTPGPARWCYQTNERCRQ